jgi:hypothetical protein
MPVRQVSKRIAEVELYPAVLKLFAKQPHAFVEVPYHGKRVDLVFSTQRMRYLYAVEVKVVNWRHAVKQAALNQLFAHLSYVALPEEVVSRFDDRRRSIFTRYNLGLIAVSGEARIEIEAERNSFFHPTHHQAVKMILKAANASLLPKDVGVLTHAIANRSRTLDLLQAWPNKRERAFQAAT